MTDRVSTSAPTVDNDETEGYVIGSQWVTIGGSTYICFDATTGSAGWVALGASTAGAPSYLDSCLAYIPLTGGIKNTTNTPLFHGDLMWNFQLNNVGNPTWVDESPFSDDASGSFSFNGSSQAIRSHQTNWQSQYIRDEDFTWTAWARPDTVALSAVAAKTTPTADRGVMLYMSATDWIWAVTKDSTPSTSTTVTATTQPSAGRWDFLAGVYDSVNDIIKISVNGEDFVTAGGVTTPNDPSNQLFSIGSRPAGDMYFDGQIRDVAWWREAFSQADVDDLYTRRSLLEGWT